MKEPIPKFSRDDCVDILNLDNSYFDSGIVRGQYYNQEEKTFKYHICNMDRNKFMVVPEDHLRKSIKYSKLEQRPPSIENKFNTSDRVYVLDHRWKILYSAVIIGFEYIIGDDPEEDDVIYLIVTDRGTKMWICEDGLKKNED